MDFTSLVSRAPIICFVVDLLGVCFSVFVLLLPPLFFSRHIIILFATFFSEYSPFLSLFPYLYFCKEATL